MFDVDASLAVVRAALEHITPDSTEQEMDAATSTASGELRRVASTVAAFANALDDGTGFFNSSHEFGRQLAAELDELRRSSTVSALLEALSVDETLMAVHAALLELHVRTGPDAADRPFLGDGQRAALEHIRGTAAAALFDSALPSDPEYDE